MLVYSTLALLFKIIALQVCKNLPQTKNYYNIPTGSYMMPLDRPILQLNYAIFHLNIFNRVLGPGAMIELCGRSTFLCCGVIKYSHRRGFAVISVGKKREENSRIGLL